jgi:penicillin-binding protein 2
MAERDTSRTRLTIVGIVCLSLFASLFARLWYLQGISPAQYRVTAQAVHLRSIHEEGPRGRILDRNGRVIVDNRVSLVLGLNRQTLKPISDTAKKKEFQALADTLTTFHLATKVQTIQQRYTDPRWGPLDFVPVVADLPSQDLELYIGEHNAEFPGVEVRRKTVRTYPYGSLAAQIVGYVGQINGRELAAKQREEGKVDPTKPLEADKKPYENDDEIGKAGVEATFESDLRGVPADRRIQVDARGNYMRTIQDAKAKPGDDVWLTIDLNLQSYAEQLLKARLDQMRGTTTKDGKVRKAPQGSVVITNPQTGEILAMASYPTYDPSLLANGIDQPTWNQLTDKAQGQPLFNWALQGAYAPGSTFKLFTSTAALQSGFLRPGNDHYNDTGVFKVNACKGEKCGFHNAGGERNGVVDVTKALTVSSDVFYYWIADGLWNGRGIFGQTPIQDWAAKYGIGSKTGVALPAESAGRLPTPDLLKQEHAANPKAFPRSTWFTGDNLNTAVGQGDDLVTPLQLVNAYATFANGGTRYTPLIVRQVTRPKDTGLNPADPTNYTVVRTSQPIPVGHVDFSGSTYAKIAAGLDGAVQAGDGTAHSAWNANKTAWPMAGKTGTAQVNNKADTSVFVAYGPVLPNVAPTYAIDVVIPEAGFGADFAAPLVFSIMKPVSMNQLPQVPPPAPAAPPGGGG